MRPAPGDFMLSPLPDQKSNHHQPEQHLWQTPGPQRRLRSSHPQMGGLLKGDDVFVNAGRETSRDFCYTDNAVQANLLAATVEDNIPSLPQVRVLKKTQQIKSITLHLVKEPL